MLCREMASLALSMWCFRHLLSGEGSDGPAPAPEVDRGRFSPRCATRAGPGFKKEELLHEFRLKRQYQPQVTHLSFVYCLYYVNTFFGKYFCFYFIIKFRNLTRRAVASLARGVFSGSALSSSRAGGPVAGADVARPGKAADKRVVSGPRGLAPCRSRGEWTSPLTTLRAVRRHLRTPAPFGASRGATPGHVGTSSGPGKRRALRGAGGAPREQVGRGTGKKGGGGPQGSGAHLLPRGHGRAFPSQCPLATAESHPSPPPRPRGGRAN